MFTFGAVASKALCPIKIDVMLNKIIFGAILVILPLSGICQHDTTVSDLNELITVVDQQPEFPGGEEMKVCINFSLVGQMPK